MSKTPDEKRPVWLERTALALGLSHDQALTLLKTVRHQSLRLNPLRAPLNRTLAELKAVGWQGSEYTWMPEGYTIAVLFETVRDSAPVQSGAAFIQNAASWLPVLALDPKPHDVILDVCAAPGGKSAHIAAMTNNQAELWVNDNSRPRLAKMRANLDRLGAVPAQTTLFDAQYLARKLDGQQFDKILLDAPCSGEGLMQYDRDKDFATWSVAHIKRLQKLQKRILLQAWQLLKPGGTLVYSTCTMAPEENEAVVDYLLRVRNDATVEPFSIDASNKVASVTTWNGKNYQPSLAGCLRLVPSQTIEAFFVAKLYKSVIPEL